MVPPDRRLRSAIKPGNLRRRQLSTSKQAEIALIRRGGTWDLGIHVGIDLGTTQLRDRRLRRRRRHRRRQRHRREPDPVGGPHRRPGRADGRPARAARPGQRSGEHARRVEAADGHRRAAVGSRPPARRCCPRSCRPRCCVAARRRARRAGLPAARGGDLDAGAVRAAAEPRHGARRRLAGPGGGRPDPGADRQRRSPPAGAPNKATTKTGPGWCSTWAAARWTCRCWRPPRAGCASSTTRATTSWAARTSTAPLVRVGGCGELARRGRARRRSRDRARRGARWRGCGPRASRPRSSCRAPSAPSIALPELAASGGGTVDVELEITRAELDGLTAPFIARAPVRRAHAAGQEPAARPTTSRASCWSAARR